MAFASASVTALDARPTIVRYERERPGELIHIDIKTLGHIDGIDNDSFRFKASSATAKRRKEKAVTAPSS
jgi:hypothetical protein